MKHILLSFGSAALAAALLCSCGPFQVAEKVVDQTDLQQIAEGLAMQAEDSANVSEALKAGLVQRTYTAESANLDKIVIEERYASIRIEPGRTDRIQVSYLESADSQVYRFSEGDSTLRIKNKSRNGVDSDVTYTTVITLPEQQYQAIEVKADNSSVTVRDVDVDSVWLRNSSNTIVQFSGLNAGRINASLINGIATVSDTTAASLDVSVSNGILRLENTQVDRYDGQVENGSIEGSILGQADEYDIRTSVDVGSNKLPSNSNSRAAKDLRLHVGNGTINVQFAG